MNNYDENQANSKPFLRKAFELPRQEGNDLEEYM